MSTQHRRDYERAWRKKNKIRYNKTKKDQVLRLRLRVINGYGGKCACCGESEIKFLSIDHKFNGKGNPAKRHCNSKTMYWWILRENFPKEIQILCHNCNFSKGAYGKCPHQEADPAAIERSYEDIEKIFKSNPGNYTVSEERYPDGKFKKFVVQT